MQSATFDEARVLAIETRFQPSALEKTLRHLDLLQEIGRNPALSERLALKGGTALNHFFFDPERLSVDIDFNFVGVLSKTAMEVERPVVEAALQGLLSSKSYVIRRTAKSHAGGKWLLSYNSVFGGRGNLELDLNYMAREPLFGTARMSSRPIGDFQANGVRVLDIHEIVAGKVVALIDRNAARDLYDVHRLLSLEGLDWGWIKAATLAIGACSRRDWRTASLESVKINPREIQQKLAICLPNDHYAVRNTENWIDETIALCREKCGFLFEFSQNEEKFLDCLLDHGDVDAALLDVTPDVRERIAVMPMLAWKSRNVRRYLEIG